MPRPPSPPTTRLGQAMAAHRGNNSGRDAAAEIGIDSAAYHRIETGTRGPSGPTARALARWLGWTTDQVLDAAEQPVTTDTATQAE